MKVGFQELYSCRSAPCVFQIIYNHFLSQQHYGRHNYWQEPEDGYGRIKKSLFPSFHLTRNPDDLKRKIMVYGAYYSFTKANAPEWFDKYDENLIVSVRIPRIYREKFQDPPICESHISRQIGNVGYIEYRFLIEGERIVATTNEYDPKRWTPSGTRGLGYFIEIITAHDLEKLGITHITTTKYPDHARCRQLKAVGLPINEEVPIREWILRLAKGVKYWSEKLLEFT